MAWTYRNGKKIEIDESKVYRVNYEDLHRLMCYCHSAGRMAQQLYYKHADPYWSDGCYDAFCKVYSKIREKYPELGPNEDFTQIVGN